MRCLQSQLFTDPHIQHPIYDLNLNFIDYIAQCKTLISQHRIDLNTMHAEKIILANAPFELRPKQSTRCGVLLLHGLFDSPLMMRDMGLALQSQGLLTRSILLPGHGTVPGDLLHVDYHQWLQAVRYGIASFAKEVDSLFLMGFSTGASLALYHTLQNTSGIKGIVLLSPVLKINSAFASMANLYKAFSWAWPRAAWLHQNKNETLDYAKYYSIPFNAVNQVYRLTQAIKKEKSSTLPLLFVLSQQDDTVYSRTSLNYFQRQLHPKNHLILYSNSDAYSSLDPRMTKRHTAYPLLRIRDFSHLSLPISPGNPHYGEEGDYRFASHVRTDDQTIYGEFTPGQIYFNEWLFKLKLSEHHYQRLTFNPDFDFLVRMVMEFINSII